MNNNKLRAVLSFAPSRRDSYRAMNNVNLRGGAIEATDGNMLGTLRVHGEELGHDGMMCASTLRTAAKAAKAKDDIKIENNGALTVTVGSAVFTAATPDGQFPQTTSLTPQGDPIVSVILGAELLRRLADAAIKHDPDIHGITFEFFTSGKPVKFSHAGRDSSLYGLIMPIRA